MVNGFGSEGSCSKDGGLEEDREDNGEGETAECRVAESVWAKEESSKESCE